MSTTPNITFKDLQNDVSAERIFIIGGGIVGSALAFYLSESNDDRKKGGAQIVVVDKSFSSWSGSTAYAPGFVGQLNESTVLTKLAKDSVREYSSIPGGFDTVGGLELVGTQTGTDKLQERCRLAREAGLEAELVSAEQAGKMAPEFVKTESVSSALYFPSDGTADPVSITRYFQKKAEERGVVFLEACVDGLETAEGLVTGISISSGKGTIRTNKTSTVILATGIWTQFLLGRKQSDDEPVIEAPVPIVPVAHPYTFTPPRQPRQGPAYSFVRWPEEHVYARDHGERDGVGSYNHSPIKVDFPFDSAIGKWTDVFEKVLEKACRTCLKNGGEFIIKKGDPNEKDEICRTPFNGIFSVTPDNLPFAGKVKSMDNLWLCAAVWVTHAAGIAKLIAKRVRRDRGDGSEMTSDESNEHNDDEMVLNALDPERFRGGDSEVLIQQALGRYNDIYNSQPVGV